MDEKLRTIFQDIFGLQPTEFSDHLNNRNLAQWDSVQHLTLILTLEQAFEVEFSPDEWPQLTSVRNIKTALRHKAQGSIAVARA